MLLTEDCVHKNTLKRWGNDILRFTTAFFGEVNNVRFDITEHLVSIAEKLNAILRCDERQSKFVIINMPPRSGKTELCIVSFVALGFAVNPASIFMHLSSSDQLVNKNVGAIRKIMQSEAYRMLFPMTQVSNNGSGSITTTRGGELYAAPFLGQITGFGCGRYNAEGFNGALLVDDPVKTQDALSETLRERVNFTWANTIISRRNSDDTPIIIVAQRTHQHDLCGFLLEEEGTVEEGGRWDLLQLPAILDEGTEDERSFWPSRRPLEELKKLRELNPWVFNTQQQQKPMPIEGLLFPEAETKYFEFIPNDPEVVFIQMDPADEGDNMYCSKVYYIKDGYCLNVDVIYTEDKLEITMPRLKEQILKWKPSYVNVESNSAWRLVAKEIKEWAAEYAPDSEVRRHNATANKENRIFNEAPTIRNRFLYLTPSKQNKEYKRCMDDMHRYLKMVKDQRDDCVDVDAAASFWAKRNKLITLM